MELIPFGDSIAILFDDKTLKRLNVKENTVFEIVAKDNSIVITPIRTKEENKQSSKKLH